MLPRDRNAVTASQARTGSTSSRSRWAAAVIALLLCIAAVGAWRYTPLSRYASPANLAQHVSTFSKSTWAPLIVIALYVLGGLVLFPLTIMIAATALLFPAWLAFVYALTGATVSAVVLYASGRFLLSRALNRSFAELMSRVSGALDARGIIAIAILRTLPLAPYTLVNLAAGALRIRLRDYVIGTALGLLPGITVLTLFGAKLKATLQHPDARNVAALVALLIAWIGLSLLLQHWSTRRQQRTHTHKP
jgi:phospholipase D1/2